MAKPSWNKDKIANNLIRSGRRWNSSLGETVTVTYSFPTATDSTFGYRESQGFSALSSAQQTAAEAALSAWSELANINFVKSTSNSGRDAQIRLSNTTTGPTVAWAYYPGSGVGGDVWFNPNYSTNKDLTPGKYGMHTMVHELGHAIGLSHPGNYNGSASYSQQRYRQDTRQYTVMSYFRHTSDPYAYSPTPLRDDIYAIQKAYGVNYNTRSGNNVYSWADNPYYIGCIWDGGGIDTIDASSQSKAVKIDLRMGNFSSIGHKSYSSSYAAANNLSIAYGAVIENANGGAGQDSLYGNDFNNVINGNGGNDTLTGYKGNDTLNGGTGDDLYLFTRDDGIDVVNDSSGTDTIRFLSHQRHQLNYEKVGSDLVLTSSAIGSQLKVSNYFSNTSKWQFTNRKRYGNKTFTDILSTDNIVNGLSTGASAVVGGTVSSSIDRAYDKDMFKVTLEAGKTYVFNMKGYSSRSGTLRDSYLSLIDSVGNTITKNNNSGKGYDARITYSVSNSGTYYLLAQGVSSRSGTYQLSTSVSDTPAAAAASNLSVGNSVGEAASSSSITTTGEKDWYKVSLQAGQTYQFDLMGRSSGSGSLKDPYLRLYSDSRTQLMGNNNSGRGYDSRVYFQASETGDYYLRAQGIRSTKGSYQLSATVNNIYQTSALGMDSSATGTVAYGGKSDWYTVNLTAGQKYTFNLKGRSSGSGTIRDSYLDVYFNNQRIGTDNNSGTGYDSSYTFEALDTGSYFLRVRDRKRKGGTYTIQSRSLGSGQNDDFAGSSSTSGTLGVGEVKSAVMDHINDKDWFKVNLTAGETYRFDMVADSSALFKKVLSDSKLSLYDTDGSTLIGSNNNIARRNKNSRMTFTAASSGTYYLSAEQMSNKLGAYTVSMAKTFV